MLTEEKSKTLSYILASNKAPITLDLNEAERYSAAVVVQQLIGNLVFYSNSGRYEPRISESWQRVSPTQWDFKLKKGYICENGELITPESFRKSLIRSFKIAAKKGDVPVFSKLIGFRDLVLGNDKDFKGITTTSDIISFHFSQPTRSGPLQLLSFAPFGYICEDNYNPDMTWKDKSKFISSGAYKVDNIVIGKEYVLVKRKEWPSFTKNSPDKILITHDIPKDENEVNSNTIIDSFTPLKVIPSKLKNYNLVPEYLCAILLGNMKDNGFFSIHENRRALDQAIQLTRKNYPNNQSNFSYSSFFYPSQRRIKPTHPQAQVNLPIKPLIIEGKIPPVDSPKYFAFKILIDAFDKLNWKYIVNNNDASWAESGNSQYDVRIMGPSIGSGVEAWGLDVIFFSHVGLNIPDPSGRVKKMLFDYENDKLSDQELTDNFLTAVEEDAAILPINHFGLQWYISSGINTQSISPLVSVIRFDQVEIE